MITLTSVVLCSNISSLSSQRPFNDSKMQPDIDNMMITNDSEIQTTSHTDDGNRDAMIMNTTEDGTTNFIERGKVTRTTLENSVSVRTDSSRISVSLDQGRDCGMRPPPNITTSHRGLAAAAGDLNPEPGVRACGRWSTSGRQTGRPHRVSGLGKRGKPVSVDCSTKFRQSSPSPSSSFSSSITPQRPGLTVVIQTVVRADSSGAPSASLSGASSASPSHTPSPISNTMQDAGHDVSMSPASLSTDRLPSTPVRSHSSSSTDSMDSGFGSIQTSPVGLLVPGVSPSNPLSSSHFTFPAPLPRPASEAVPASSPTSTHSPSSLDSGASSLSSEEDRLSLTRRMTPGASSSTRHVNRTSNMCETDFERLGRTMRALQDACFYYPDLDSDGARDLLEHSPLGTFLVRGSSDPRFLFAITMKTERGPTSVRIRYARGLFQMDCENQMKKSLPRFETLLELLDFHAAMCRDQQGSQYRWLEGSRRKDLVVKLSSPRRHSPPSLTHLARLTINRSLEDLHLPARSTDLLPLPDSVKQYLRAYPHKV